MGFWLAKSKDKDTSSQLSSYSTKTTGPAVARSFNGGTGTGTGTCAEKGGRAAAVSRNGSAWSKSVAYGGDSDHNKHNPYQVSSRDNYAYTSGNAIAGVIKGGTFAYAGPGGYGEAVYRDGSSFGATVAYGGKKTDDAYHVCYSGRIESYYPSSDDEGEESDR